MLYIVSTPIGNLKDITLRAIETLKEVDFIAAEDTRHSGILLKHYEIKTPMTSFHAHSDNKKVEHIIDRIAAGEKAALISDAGTPGISDPGYILIKKAIEQGIQIIPIPGASAFLTALTVSGLPVNKFLYLGFLPTKKGRQTLFRSLKEEKRTVVFYESPHRIIKTLKQMIEFLGPDRKIAICRELTKIYEETLRLTISKALDHFSSQKPKGEFVICLHPAE